MLVRLDHAADRIVNTDHSATSYGRGARLGRGRRVRLLADGRFGDEAAIRVGLRTAPAYPRVVSS